MHQLALHIAPEAGQLFSARKADKAFLPFKKKVFLRDNHTCGFCGFQARDYLEVVNLDGNYRNNKLSNLATACCFCSQCFFLESIGQGEYGGGSLIYCPEIPQNELNSLCHVLFCAISNDTGYKSSAKSIYRSLKFRAQMVEDKYGEGTSDPVALAQLLLEASVDKKICDEKVLVDIRLLPSRVRFARQIERWAQAALEELSSEDEDKTKDKDEDEAA